MKIAFAGDKDISVDVLEFILEQGTKPSLLFVPSEDRASHSAELIDLCSYLNPDTILRGDTFRKEKGLDLIDKFKLDYIISVHFPYIYTKKIFDKPKHGVLNLHPAFLPYNRGWHTPSWAIYENTPYGATLHFMDEDTDTGDIVRRKKIAIRPQDTADSLYKRVKELELEIFKEAWPELISEEYTRKPQPREKGSSHKKGDLQEIQKIQLDKKVRAKDLIDKLRALTTNKQNEAAYFRVNGTKYRIQVSIHKGSKETD